MSKPTTKLTQESITAVYCASLKIADRRDPHLLDLEFAYVIADKAIQDLKLLIEAYEGDEV